MLRKKLFIFYKGEVQDTWQNFYINQWVYDIEVSNDTVFVATWSGIFVLKNDSLIKRYGSGISFVRVKKVKLQNKSIIMAALTGASYKGEGFSTSEHNFEKLITIHSGLLMEDINDLQILDKNKIIYSGRFSESFAFLENGISKEFVVKGDLDSFYSFQPWNFYSIKFLKDSDTLYIGTWLDGIWKCLIKGETLEVIKRYKDELPTPYIATFTEIGKDTFIVACFEYGIAILTKDGNVKVIDVENKKPTDDLTIDNKGRIWIGSLVGGVYVYDREGKLFSLDQNDGLPSNYVSSVYALSDGRVLIGTISGLAVYEENYRIKDILLGGEIIYNIKETPWGEIWILTDKRIVVFNNSLEEIKSFDPSNSPYTDPIPENPEIGTIKIDWENGKVYIGAKKGILIYKTNYKRQTSFDNVKIFPNPCYVEENSFLNITNLPPYTTGFIFSQSGKFMKKFEIKDKSFIKIDVGNFPTGLYFIYLKGQNKEKILKFSVVK